MPIIHIIRGIPGSGKSTLACSIIHGRIGSNDIAHYEADQFMVDHNGKYRFDPALLKSCHEACRQGVENAMKLGQDVIVSNTFVKKWEFASYLDLAQKYGYQVQEIIVKGDFGNTHNVPKEVVERMKRDFEY